MKTLGFLHFRLSKTPKIREFQKIWKNLTFWPILDLQNGPFSDKKPPGDPQGASQDNPRSPQEPPGSILEPPGPIWEPPGSIFEPPGADFGPILHKSGHKAQNVKKNRVRHGPLGV